MPQRDFDTGIWGDPFFQKLSETAQKLFIYLWTNSHCNQAGLYEITLPTIAFEAKLPQESLPDLIKSLEPKVVWDAEQDIIWVKAFLKRQCKSPKFLVAAVKCVESLPDNGFKVEYFYHNDTVFKQYRYNTDIVSIPSNARANTRASANAGGVVKGGEAKKTWEAVLKELQLQVTKTNYDTWLKDTEGLGYQGNQLVVRVPSGFATDWLNNRLRSLIKKILINIEGNEVDVLFQAEESNGQATK